MNSQFNAIDYAQQLEAAGVPQVQAEVHAKTLSHALSNFVASKADLAALSEKITARMDIFEARIVTRIGAFEAKVERELATMRVELADMRVELADMRVQLADMRTDISVLRGEMTYHRRMINLVLAIQVALLVKLFFP
jgi:hypothetical protein